MAEFKAGKPLLPCNFDHQRHGPWSNLPLVMYRIRTAETCSCLCKLCLNPPKPVAESESSKKQLCSERCKVHNLRKDPEVGRVWKKDYFDPDSYGVRQ